MSSIPSPVPRRRSTGRLVSAGISAALLAAALAPLSIAPAHAELSGRGPVDPQNGFPTWYSDGNVKLAFCYTVEQGCLSTPPNAGPASYPDNFPEEAFWFAAEASGGNLRLYEAALEGAHLNDAVVPGEQMGFARLRFRLANLVAGEKYTITHPYGVNEVTAAADGTVFETIDDGACAPTAAAACDWDAVGAAFLGNYEIGTTASFLRQVNAPAGKLGDPNVASKVTGAPSGNNFVTVTGLNAGGPGVNTLTVDTFTIQGVISDEVDGAPGTPDLAAASDSGRSGTDNITSATAPVFTGTATPGTAVELLLNDGITPIGSGAATAAGTYSLTPTAALPEGVHKVRARTTNPAFATDPAAPQYLTSTPLTLTVDTTPAPVAVTSPLPSNPSLDRTPSLSFSSTDAGATFDCQLMPTNTQWASNCTSPLTYDEQADGAFTFNVRSQDAAGNVSAPASYSWQIGAAAPAAAEQKDMNGDGNPDIITRDSAGALWLYPGNGRGQLNPRIKIGSSGWNAMNSILMPGDFNGDKKSDVIARDTNGLLWLYPGSGTGGLSPRTQIGTGWNGFTALVTPGDFNADGKADLLARDSTGALLLYPGNGAGRFLTRTVAGASGWNAMTAMTGVGTSDAGATTDMVARDSTGRLWFYPGTGTGRFGARTLIGSSGWNAMNALSGPGAFDTGTTMDLLARDANGVLWLYPGNGNGGLGSRVQAGTGFQTMNMLTQ